MRTTRRISSVMLAAAMLCMPLFASCSGEPAETEHVHSLQKVEAKDATCLTYGSVEHYVCEGCGKLFKDAEGAERTTRTAVQTERLPHEIEEVEAQPATCTEDGYIAHYECKNCHTKFTDDAGGGDIS